MRPPSSPRRHFSPRPSCSGAGSRPLPPMLPFSTPHAFSCSPVARFLAMLGGLIALQCATDLVYVAPGVVLPLVAIAAFRLRDPATRAAGRRLTAALVLGLGMVTPVVAAHAMLRVGDPSLAARSVWNIATHAHREALTPYLVGGVPQVPLDLPSWSRGNGGPLRIP